MTKQLIIVSTLLLMYFSSVSQNQLNLLDGRQIKLESYVFHSNEGYMDYSFVKKNGKIKKTYAELNDVYSINIAGKDSIIYKQMLEEEYSPEEMSRIVVGRHDALVEYKPWWALTAGLAVGCSSFLFIDGLSMWLIPIGFTTGMAFVQPSNSFISKRHDLVANDDFYLFGYKSTGRRKIIKNTAIGTVGGMLIGGIIIAILNSTSE